MSKIKDLEEQVSNLNIAIKEKDAMNVKHLEVNNKLAGDVAKRNKTIIQLESDKANYEKIFAKKDKQVERQFRFIQEYREGLVRLGNAYKNDGICDNGAIEILVAKINELLITIKGE